MIQDGTNADTGMPENNKCAAGRTGWSAGNRYSTCDAECPEGYFCAAGTKLRWPANTAALKVKWAKITCGMAAGKTIVKTDRYTPNYAASVYCPAGTSAIKTVDAGFYSVGPADASGSILQCRKTPGKKCRGGGSVPMCCWRAAHGHDDDNYIQLRVGQKKCKKNSELCLAGVRAPSLNFEDVSKVDSCGGEAFKTVSAMVATPNDAVLTQVVVDLSSEKYRFHYLDSRDQQISLDIDTKVPVTVRSDEDALFANPVYTIVDEISGSSHWQSEDVAQNDDNLGLIRLKDSKAIRFPRMGGSNTRVLFIKAKRAIIAAPSTSIKTLKPCKLIVTLRNSNDRPTVPANQIRSIDEQSAQDLLVQTPIDADDEDEGQGLIFTLVRTERGDVNRNAKDTPNKNEVVGGDSQPFVVGQCSGIIKVKDDVLRYDFDQMLDDAGINSGIRQYKLIIHVEDKDDDDQEFSTGRSCFIDELFFFFFDLIVGFFVLFLTLYFDLFVILFQEYQFRRMVPRCVIIKMAMVFPWVIVKSAVKKLLSPLIS